MGHLITFISLTFLTAGAAAHALGADHWLGTYISSADGVVRAAVRIYFADDALRVDFWKHGLVRQLGQLRSTESPSTRIWDLDGRVISLRVAPAVGRMEYVSVAGTTLLSDAQRLDGGVEANARYSVSLTDGAVHAGVAFEDFRTGLYDSPSVFTDCELILMR